MDPLTVIVKAVSEITTAAIGLVDRNKQRRHEGDMADYQNTQFKQFFNNQESGAFNSIAVVVLGLIVIALIWGIIKKK